ncbi:MAG: alpha/beta hydrolase family protein, partial [Candidatus Ratteibacteria bacterium]
MKTTIFLLMAIASILYGQQFTEPIFNIQTIVEQVLDAKILSRSVSDGIVLQEVEFTSEVYQNNPVRIYGIVGFPEGAKKIPAILWCQAGMAPANRYMPEMFAKRGYVCMCITLPHKVWNPWAAFNTKNPQDANLTHFAIAQMRAITYLCSMPEVDTEKIGVGGSSYGGFFSTLIAVADPRIKCGMSFFAGGNMALGTHLPQFTNLETLQDVDVWNRTIDPAFRLKFRKVPFLWAAASNDNWFYLPSVVKTYQDSIGEKRLAIVPLWEHGFPEEVDEQLFSWFDIYLKQTKKPYNSVSLLTVKKNKSTLQASWSFSGDNKIKKAELVVSYGKIEPWKWWIHRN